MISNYKKRRLLIILITIIAITLVVIVIRFINNAVSPTDIDIITLYITLAEAFGLVTSLTIAIFQLMDSKEISRASFITELNKAYVENDTYVNLYNRLQQCIDKNCELHEGTDNYFTDVEHDCLADVKKSDISNYLTFFETLYILYCRGVIKFHIIDDLFAYRFFMAVHSRLFQKAKLEPQYENFKNIYRLEYKWLKHHNNPKNRIAKDYTIINDVYNTRLLVNLLEGDIYCKLVGINRREYCGFVKKFLRISISPKDYIGTNKPSDYLVSGKDDTYKFLIRKCTRKELDEILKIQDEAFLDIPGDERLRKNPKKRFIECLRSPNVTLGAWYEGKLAGFAILYYPHNNAENLSISLEDVELRNEKAANYKLCIVRKEFWGNSLQYKFGQKIESYAIKSGVNLLCATVSPENHYSINNILRLGYIYNRSLLKYGYERNLYYKFI